jgi:hypothetical protein
VPIVVEWRLILFALGVSEPGERRSSMATPVTPVRVPERTQPAPRENGGHPASWPQRKPSRFVIKIAGNIPC